jgi:osmotically-inducible protein OsmY
VERYESGPHSGRGPKGYQRSDERIREEICEALTRHPQIDASEIEVTCHNGEVTLKGTVENRQMKRRAEECAESCVGVEDVENQLRVSPSQQQDGQPNAQGTPSSKKMA